jgi:hypothetical protein
MGAIEACRTAALGGHVERCAECGLIRIAYNSCRNRHCPKCALLTKRRFSVGSAQTQPRVIFTRTRSTTHTASGMLEVAPRVTAGTISSALAELIRSTRAPTKDRLIGKIMGGNPAFRGTRVPVHMLAELVPSRVRARTPYRRGSVTFFTPAPARIDGTER